MWNTIIYFNSYIVMSRLKQWQLQNSVFPQCKNSLNIDAYISVFFKNVQKSSTVLDWSFLQDWPPF